MPSVEMRKRTRIFGTRVLRSGRRLWSGPGEGKHVIASADVANGEEWIELLDNSGDGGGSGSGSGSGGGGGGGGDDDIQYMENSWPNDAGLKQVIVMDIDKKIAEPKLIGNGRLDVANHNSNVNRMWGSVYQSKRKRIVSKSSVFEGSFEKITLEDWRYGKKYIRQQWRKKKIRESCPGPLGISCGPQGSARSRVLLAFVKSSSCSSIRWFACILGVVLRSACLRYVPVTYSNEVDDRITEVVEHLPCISFESDSPVIGTVTFENDNSGKRNVLYSAVGAPRLTGRAGQFRSGVGSRGIQKKRSSLRSRRKRNPSVFRGRKTNGALASNLFSYRHDGIPLVPITFDRERRSYVRKSSTPNIKQLKTSSVGLEQDTVSSCCSANILVIESYKCYRIEGAIVELEKISGSKPWSLAVRKDGITRYTLSAQKVMRPYSTNRVTHDVIWTQDINNWKLEFPNRRDWLIFKELYKECSERNVLAPSANVIPVPGVYEVPGYADSKAILFNRPNSYISVRNDELSRAFEKRTANYDMDSEDEEWLIKFNNDPDGNCDEKAAVNLYMHLERKEVVEAVYGYWMRKRKQKHSALIRVFQMYAPRRTQLLPNCILRKKRSFKRQASQSVRIKQRTFLQAVPEERDSVEEQNALIRVQEAKAAARRSEGLAIAMRQAAQVLIEKADLATYRATKALRIAEAARVRL
ncbi:enhancer of polycomb-like transcription factor protein [Actinidia rufa]|uniref:Enhancer of polycomb-like transcription factor protein n=1 Tax=Actinidia rufa TaxID=165716 RepID=A0A7J0GV13_9ERIC|nr:enhancer of polycomb-like transcription factor protein [Actinidia rufa]